MVVAALLFVLSSVLFHGENCQAIDSSSSYEELETFPSGARIIGGHPVSVELHPWFITIVTLDNLNWALKNPAYGLRFVCGASLISPNYALSAAHCFADSIGNKYEKNKAGVFGLKNRCTSKWDSYDVFSNVVVHEDYNHREIINDIALIYLSRDRTEIPPICLPQPGSQHMGSREIVGFGSIRSQIVDLPCTLMGATVRMYSRDECLKTDAGHDIAKLPGAFCASLPEERRSTCTGDSGGPLMNRENGTFNLEGIVSFGPALCADHDFPGVFTNVSYYLDWLTSTVEKTKGPNISSQEGCGVAKLL